MKPHESRRPRTRTLFWKRHVKPEKPADPRPCQQQWHAGPLLLRAVYDRFGPPWAGMGECARCGSTVHHSQVRRAG